MFENLTIKQELLARIMSDISERCYCAGWIKNLEYVLWHAMITGERKYGHDVITQRDIDTLKLLSDETNSWIFFDDELYEIAIDLVSWHSKFKNVVSSNPEILKKY
jgi:hypothetical protein